jgi:colanic acid/amylovoran biosynthesis glycosyltransferase
MTGTVGEPSETFVRRHICDLLPNRTVCIARRRYPGPNGWKADVPTLVLEEVAPLVRLGGAGMLTRTLGLTRPDRLLSPPHARAVVDFVKHHEVGAALGEFLDATLPFVRFLEDARIPLVAHSHGSDVSVRLRRGWWRRAYGEYRRSERVIAVSQLMKRRLADETPIPPENIAVIPCGSPILPNDVARPRTDSQVHCLAVGRLVPVKDPLGTLVAFLAASERARQPMRLTMVGDGPLRRPLEEAVRRSGAAARIRVLGTRPHQEVQNLLADSDVFLHPSKFDPATGSQEGLPVAVLEAMSHGLAIVTTRHGGIPEAIDDGDTGFLVDEEDYNGMAARILELARSPELRRELGARARARHAAEFSWEQEHECLTKLLDPYLA